MDLTNLKKLLEETQENLPPHYPIKLWDVEREVATLIENLKKIVDFIGFSNANIAIKNIIGKMTNEFLISTLYGSGVTNCNFQIVRQTIENGEKITISYKDKSLVLEYLNNGAIVITNNSTFPFSCDEDYSNSIISYNSKAPDVIILNQIFKFKSSYHSAILFSSEGIEIAKHFKIIPRTPIFKPTNQSIIGTIIRESDFFTATIRLAAKGTDFGNIISPEDITAINSIPFITVPISYMGALKNDLNLLYIVTNNDRSSAKNGGIQYLVGNYTYAENMKENFPIFYEESKVAVKNSQCLEVAGNILSTNIVHGPYSAEILKKIKEVINKPIDKRQSKQ